MNHFTTLLIRNLLNNEHNLPEFESVLSEVFRQQLEEAVNDVLNYELEQFLGYERYRHTDKTDSRNGFKPDRTIDTKYGPITIKMPRDRLGLFASSLIPAYVRRTEGTERSVIDLFDLGLINSEITEAVDRMFGAKVSKGIVQKEAVHIALGIRTDGTKEILDYSIAPNESRTNWKDMIVTIRERVALFCTDSLNGSTNMQNSFNKGIRIYTKFLTLSFFQILDYSFT
jgi:transposase-like protein